MSAAGDDVKARLEALRKKKRLAELRAKSESRPDPFITSPTQPFEGVSDSGQGLTDAALSVASSAAGAVAGGLAGALGDKFGPPLSSDERAERIQTIQSDFNRSPKTEEGQARLEDFTKQLDALSKLMSLPVVGLEGAAAFISSGGDPDAANSAMRAMLEQGVSNRLGERNLQVAQEAGASPTISALAGTAASLGPEAAVAIGGGGAAAASVRGATRIAEKIKERAGRTDFDVFDEQGRFTDESLEIISQMENRAEVITEAQEAGITLTREQAERFNLFAERRVPALRADITQSTADSIDQRQAIKEGGAPAVVAAEQEKRLAELLDEGVKDTGGNTLTVEETNASIRGAISGRAETLDQKITAAYAQAKEAAQGQPLVDISGYINWVRSIKGKDKVAEGGISSALTDLRNNDLLKKDANTLVTVEQAETLRQGLNKDFDPQKPARNRFIREAKDRLDDSVESAVGVDIFADARQAKINFGKEIERARRDKFDESKGSLVEDILTNKIPEEKIFEKIISRTTRADDLKKLRDFLLDSGQEQVWNDLRAQTMRQFLDDALSTQAKREGGIAVFNVNKFKTSVKRLRGEKFDILFDDAEKKLINDISEIGTLRVPIEGTFAGEGPTSLAVKRATRAAFLSRLRSTGPVFEIMVEFLTGRKRDKRLTEFTQDTEQAIKRNR